MWPFISVKRFLGCFTNTGGVFDTGHLPDSIAGTASVVVCDVASTFLYQVDDDARAAKPGYRFALISPVVVMRGQSGASSRTIHTFG